MKNKEKILTIKKFIIRIYLKFKKPFKADKFIY